MSELLSQNIKNPFLRWTGSKRWFTKEYIEDFLPVNFANYHEPFLGGGAVFFHIKNINKENRKYFLSDLNEELINCYIQLRDNIDYVIQYLKKFENTETQYYLIRKAKFTSLPKRAARFIYLNRTSFNGIYRVNSLGHYNVPFGKRTNVDIVTENALRSVSQMLKSTKVTETSFEKRLRYIKKGDFVFIDPPYTVAHENNGFIEYNQKLFSWEDQLKLKEFIQGIIEKEAFFVLTNASHQSILELYQEVGSIATLSRTSKVGGRTKTRGVFNELVFYNTL